MSGPTPEQSRARGYLVYETPAERFGIGHSHGNLAMQLMEAWSLNRIPVTESNAPLTPMHSGGKRRGACRRFHWRDYLRLDQTFVVAKSTDGSDGAPAHWPFLVVDSMQDWLAGQGDVREIAGDVMPGRDESAEVLVRSCTARDGKPLGFYPTHLRHRYRSPDSGFPTASHTRFLPAEHIRETTAKVVAWLGNEFWGLHLRRGDWLPLVPPQYLYASDARQVAKTLRMAGATPSTRIFLMTNESSPRFVEPLRRVCDLAWERECPPLLELGKDSGDNYQVHWAGICVMAYAQRLFGTRNPSQGIRHAERLPPKPIPLPAAEPIPAEPGKDAVYVSQLVDEKAVVPLSYRLHWLYLRHVALRLRRALARISGFRAGRG